MPFAANSVLWASFFLEFQMTAKIIDGNAVAASLRVEFKQRVKALADGAREGGLIF